MANINDIVQTVKVVDLRALAEFAGLDHNAVMAAFAECSQVSFGDACDTLLSIADVKCLMAYREVDLPDEFLTALNALPEGVFIGLGS